MGKRTPSLHKYSLVEIDMGNYRTYAVVLAVHGDIVTVIPLRRLSGNVNTLRGTFYISNKTVCWVSDSHTNIPFSALAFERMRAVDKSRIQKVWGHIKRSYRDKLLLALYHWLRESTGMVGEVILYNFSHNAIGSEINKVRYAIVIRDSSDKKVFVAPVTSRKRVVDEMLYHASVSPTDMTCVNGDITLDGTVYFEQCQTVYKSRILSRIGEVDGSKFAQGFFWAVVGKQHISEELLMQIAKNR